MRTEQKLKTMTIMMMTTWRRRILPGIPII